MDLSEQLVVISCIFFACFLFLRFFIYGVILHRIRGRTHSNRSKGQTLKDWFLYSRFKEVIPKFILFVYYSTIIIHLLAAIMCVLFNFMDLSEKLGDPTARIMYYFDGIWVLALWLAFWSPKEIPKYDRWISKKWKKKDKPIRGKK